MQKPNKNTLIIFALILVGIAFVAVSFISGVKVFHEVHHKPFPRRETNVELVQGWMTIPYISRVYAVPEPELINSLNLGSQNIKRISLDEIARKNNLDRAAFILKVKVVIENFQSAHKVPEVLPFSQP